MVGYQEVRQYKEEWGVVMQKLENVASLLVKVGSMYPKHDLIEELPSDISTALGSLERCVLYITHIFHVLILIKGPEWD
jgi:hypothetical protein